MGKSIAISGKGGVGKSTISALIISSLVRNKTGPVLAIDADPDANLSILLGIEPNQTIGDLREQALREIKDFPAGMSKASYVEAGLHQVIEEYEGFDLITMGKGEGSGCYCYLNSLIRKFCDDLMPEYPWVVIDNEAGLEHISRRTSANIDSLLIVVNNNPVSLRTAKKIEEITRNLKNNIGQKYIITNMLKPEKKEEVEKQISQWDMEYLCDIPYDDGIEKLTGSGSALKNLRNESIEEKIELIIKKVEENYGNS